MSHVGSEWMGIGNSALYHGTVSVENRNRHTLSRFFFLETPTQAPSTEYDVQWKVSEGGDGGMAGY